jgi:2-keto-3-deoxy-L-rhamnonate aldolase RhmA
MSNIVPNHALRQLRAGKLAIGLGLQQARTVGISQIAKTAGFDWLFIDGEHSSIDPDTAAQIAAASLAVGITPVVRVAGLEHWHASRMLDNGAQGIVAPHVDTPEEARRVANACRYPPIGKRSMGGGLQQVGFAAMPVGEVARVVNEETLVVVMIESAQAVENCDAIAAVPGVDALLIGTNDFCFELGIPGKFDDPKVEDAYRKVVAACKKAGIHPGMGGVYDPKLMEKYIGYGMRLILSGGDISFLMAGAKQRAEFLKGIKL